MPETGRFRSKGAKSKLFMKMRQTYQSIEKRFHEIASLWYHDARTALAGFGGKRGNPDAVRRNPSNPRKTIGMSRKQVNMGPKLDRWMEAGAAAWVRERSGEASKRLTIDRALMWA